MNLTIFFVIQATLKTQDDDDDDGDDDDDVVYHLHNQPTIYFPQLKQIQSKHCKQQRKATREAMRLNELVAYVKK